MNVTEFMTRLRGAGLKTETLEYAEKESGVRRSILLAIIYVESRGDEKAMRYEKHFRWTFREEGFAKRHRVTLETELQLQKFSYGLFQIMGGTARSRCGYAGQLTDLLDANTNAMVASEFIGKLRDRYQNIEDTISAYNQGSPRKKFMSKKYKNQAYVDKVLRAAWELGYRGRISKMS